MSFEEPENLRHLRLTATRRKRMLNSVKHLIQRLFDPRVLRAHFLGVTELDLSNLCHLLPEALSNEPACLNLSLDKPINIIGDIRGRYNYLIQIFDRQGRPPDACYLFLGNYGCDVDRSVETLALLFAFKLLYPDSIYLLRGKFEAAATAKTNGLYHQIVKRYTSRLWLQLIRVFDYLPFAAILDNHILCVHGGLSPLFQSCNIQNVSKLKEFLNHSIKRPVSFRPNSVLTHVVWSSPDEEVKRWEQNPAGLGYLFGPRVVSEFCNDLGLTHIINSGEMSREGYSLFAEPHLLTIFSAPELRGPNSNDGAFVHLQRFGYSRIRARVLLVKPVPTLRYPKVATFEEHLWDIGRRLVAMRSSQSRQLAQ